MHKNNFDFLRFALAFVVVLSHIIVLSKNSALSPLYPYFDSYISVTGFFIISGFLITKSYYSTSNIKSYFIKRINRLLPGYVLIILLSGILLSLLSELDVHSYYIHPGLFRFLFYNLIFMNFISPCLPGVFINNNLCAVNGSLWTIKIEVGFYILMPFLAFIFNKFRKKLIILCAIYLGSLLYKNVIIYYYEQTGNEIFNTLVHQLPGFMSYFVCGIALNYYMDDFLKYKGLLMLLALPVFGIEYYFTLEILKPLALSIIIFYIAYSLKWLNNFGKYGDVSFGVYIYHFPIIQIFVSLGFFETYNPWILSIAIVIIVLALAFLSWHLLEKKFLKRRFKHSPSSNI